MKQPSEELIDAFLAWQRITNLEVPVYLRLEQLMDVHLGAKKDDRIERGKLIVELSRSTLRSQSTSTEESTTSPKNTQVGSKLKQPRKKRATKKSTKAS